MRAHRSHLRRIGGLMGAVTLLVPAGGCGAMVVAGVGEALARTVAEGLAIEAAAQAACKSTEPRGTTGAAVCGGKPAEAKPPEARPPEVESVPTPPSTDPLMDAPAG